MFLCCLSIFFSPSRKQASASDSRNEFHCDTRNKHLSRTKPPTAVQSLPNSVQIEKLSNALETSDSEKSFHIVKSQFSEDGSHTATVTPSKISSQEFENYASYHPTASNELQNNTREEERDDHGELDTLRRICSEPIVHSAAEDLFLKRYRKWSERHSLRLVDHEDAALRRMKGSVLRAHTSMTFHF